MPPLSVMIKPVSGLCNMRCRYCFYADEMKNRARAVYPRMSTETLETLVRKVMAYADGSVTFAFQGGEPTLIGLPFFEALIRFQRRYNARGLRIQNALQTNGYDLPDELIRFFAEHHFLLGVSLDGIRDVHDGLRRDHQDRPTYDRVTENIRRLQEAGVEFNILCVVNADVARRGREVFGALAPYGYIQFIACLDELDGTVREYSLTPELYLDFLKVTFDLYEAAYRAGKPVSIRNFDNWLGLLMGHPPENCGMCGKCSVGLVAEGDGSLFPCDFYAADEWRLGSILEGPLRRVMACDTASRFVSASLTVPGKCRSCRWYPLCRNGCRRERDADGLNRWCSCFSAFFDYAYERMMRMAEEISDKK